MASQQSLVRLLVLCLLCGACAAAAKPRYHTVSMDKLLRSKAHIDCPPLDKSVTASGNKLTIPAVCGLPGPPDPPRKCCGQFEREVLKHDMNRLRTLLQRSSVSSSAAAPAPSADPFPGIPFFGPAPSEDPWFDPAPSPRPRPGIPIPYLPPVAPPTPSEDPFPWFFPPVAPPAEAPAVTIPDSTGSSLDTLEFVVTVGFGTPAKNYTLTIDTGSDVSWIQCQPCSGGHCHKQHDPVFDPTKSATYSAVPCGHPQCAAAGGKCSNGTCLYSVVYADDSSTAGVLSHETLSLTSNRSLPGFAFGCGQKIVGDFGEVDGLIGLGRGALSLSSQTAATFGARFSYCLASYDTVHGYLTIGATTPDPNDVVQYTAMKQKKDYPSFYFVDLVAIDIGGYVVPVPPTVFTKDGTLLDSGTTLMYLPSEAYTLLRDRFKYVMNWTGYSPAPAYHPLDTCYDFSGDNTIFLPAVSFNFSDGSVFGLSPVAILVYPDDTAPATGCFAFLPRPSTMPFNIIGNIQQKGTEIIYDVAAEKIGFGQAYC